MLKKGDQAPNFILRDSANNNVSLSSFVGKNVVVYFYPKDNTPGCTLEAQDFSGLIGEFAKKETVVIGISKDTPDCHKNFIDMYGLKIILLADIDAKTCNDYGIIGTKKMFGKEYQGINRATFLIDKNGFIANVWNNVKITNHANDVLNFIDSL